MNKKLIKLILILRLQLGESLHIRLSIIWNDYGLHLHLTLKRFYELTWNFDENEIISIRNSKLKNFIRIDVKMEVLWDC